MKAGESVKSELTPSMLAMYLGCQVQTPNGIEKLICIDTEKSIGDCKLPVITITGDHQRRRNVYGMDEMKPIFRHLSSMTDDEKLEVANILGGSSHLSAESRIFQVTELMKEIYHKVTNIPGIRWWRVADYLRSRYIDIDELIDAGLAIDKETLKQ